MRVNHGVNFGIGPIYLSANSKNCILNRITILLKAVFTRQNPTLYQFQNGSDMIVIRTELQRKSQASYTSRERQLEPL